MEAPKHLSAEVSAVWVEIVDLLGARAPLLVGPEFEAYCACVARLRDVQQRIQAEQLIVPDSKNQPVVHPAFAIERQCMDDLRKWGDRFSARAGAAPAKPAVKKSGGWQ